MITLIAARARNHAIGKDNTIPWYIPEDFAMFKRETLGGALIMGRLTWDSLPVKPLKSRLNVVVTSNADLCEHTAPSIEAALELCAGYSRIYGIGGAGIYAGLLPHADRIMLSEVDLDIPDADAFFPAFDESDWHLLNSRPLRATDPACTLRELVRKR